MIPNGMPDDGFDDVPALEKIRDDGFVELAGDAAAKGFDFEMLGKALIAIFKTEFSKIEAMEALFVTSGKDAINELESVAEPVRLLGRSFRRDAWRAKGFDLIDCTMGTDCASCEEKPGCDDIRDVVKIRKTRDRKNSPWAPRSGDG